MHHASLIGETLHRDAPVYGWKLDAEKSKHDWNTLVNHVQNYIKSSNFQYRVDLRDHDIEYINGMGTFIDQNTIQVHGKSVQGNSRTLSSRNFIIAVGGKPNFPEEFRNIPNCITSDDIFSLSKPPGKTLVIGGSYIALECAGFIHGLGFETKVMMRSIPLRGFDRECADRVQTFMKHRGIPFIQPCIPVDVKATESGRARVLWRNVSTGEENSDEFDTVLFAIGRTSMAAKIMGLEKAGVKLNQETGKIYVNEYEQTNIPNIFAIGDCVDGGLELTPVAIQAGNLLGKRIFNPSLKHLKMDYHQVPTTVFTPVEYGCCGLSEEAAIEKYGSDRIEVYHIHFKPLEWSLPALINPSMDHSGEEPKCMMKLVCQLQDNKEFVVGFHYVGPNAGEITQGVAVAIKCRATKEDFDNTIGIHPTAAEEMTMLSISKRSGLNAHKKGC